VATFGVLAVEHRQHRANFAVQAQPRLGDARAAAKDSSETPGDPADATDK